MNKSFIILQYVEERAVEERERLGIRFHSVSKADITLDSDTFAGLICCSMCMNDQSSKTDERVELRC
jgi:hypothetical protein